MHHLSSRTCCNVTMSDVLGLIREDLCEWFGNVKGLYSATAQFFGRREHACQPCLLRYRPNAAMEHDDPCPTISSASHHWMTSGIFSVMKTSRTGADIGAWRVTHGRILHMYAQGKTRLAHSGIRRGVDNKHVGSGVSLAHHPPFLSHPVANSASPHGM